METMSALAEALLAAQRAAIGAASKAFVAGTLTESDLFELLDDIGARDTVEQAQLLASLHALQRFGSSAPAATNGTPENETATDAQLRYINKLVEERGVVAPEVALTKAQASEIIEQLKAGTYDADKWVIPF
jgi:hypothetical protein